MEKMKRCKGRCLTLAISQGKVGEEIGGKLFGVDYSSVFTGVATPHGGRFWARIMEEKKRRERDILLMEEQRQELEEERRNLAQIRHNIDQQKKIWKLSFPS
jgi:hypothetical protein